MHDVPPFEAVLQEVEEGFLHHVGDFVTFERRADEHHGSHGRHHIVRRDRLGLLEERLALLLRAGAAGQAGLVQLRAAERVRVVARRRRGGAARVRALAVRQHVVERAQVRRGRRFAGVQPTVPHLLLLALLLDPQRLQLHRARYEADVRILLHQVADPPIVVVLFLVHKRNSFKSRPPERARTELSLARTEWSAKKDALREPRAPFERAHIRTPGGRKRSPAHGQQASKEISRSFVPPAAHNGRGARFLRSSEARRDPFRALGVRPRLAEGKNRESAAGNEAESPVAGRWHATGAPE